MQVLVFSIFFILVFCVVGTTAVSNTLANVPTHCESCTTRGMINDVQKELSDLNCIKTKFKQSIKVLRSLDRAERAQDLRVKYLEEVESSIQILSEELEALIWKCSRFVGVNCDEGCVPGYIGNDCSQMACFGVASTEKSCSGHGLCLAPNNCTCDYPYFGSECQYKNISLIKHPLGYKYEDGYVAKSCKEYKNPTYPYRYSNEGNGLYQIDIEGNLTTVYCEMTLKGGGFVFVRRVSTQKWWPLNDKFTGKGFGTYDPNSILSPNIVFGLNFENFTRTEVLIKTGDGKHWILLNQKVLQIDSFQPNTNACTARTEIIASSKYPNSPRTSTWCRRTSAGDDPLVSIEDHHFNGRTANNDGEDHSMLWGESGNGNWSYWKNNHNGINVFIR